MAFLELMTTVCAAAKLHFHMYSEAELLNIWAAVRISAFSHLISLIKPLGVIKFKVCTALLALLSR